MTLEETSLYLYNVHFKNALLKIKALLKSSKGLLNFILILLFNLDKQIASRRVFLAEQCNRSSRLLYLRR